MVMLSQAYADTCVLGAKAQGRSRFSQQITLYYSDCFEASRSVPRKGGGRVRSLLYCVCVPSFHSCYHLDRCSELLLIKKLTIPRSLLGEFYWHSYRITEIIKFKSIWLNCETWEAMRWKSLLGQKVVVRRERSRGPRDLLHPSMSPRPD